MDDMIEWLRECLDTTERLARAVTAEDWHHDIEYEYGMNEWDPAVRAHVQANDPARVLRQVAAHREILDLHDGDHQCSTRDHNGDIDSYSLVVGGPCSTVVLLASIYSDRPGHRTEWAA